MVEAAKVVEAVSSLGGVLEGWLLFAASTDDDGARRCAREALLDGVSPHFPAERRST
jgi:hypothetical protein